MSAPLVLAVALGLIPAQPAEDEVRLKALLVELARAPAEPEHAAAHLNQYRQAWRLLEGLPAERRAAWTNTLLAVLCLPIPERARASARSEEAEGAAPKRPPRTAAEARKEETSQALRAIDSYRALLAHAKDDRPEALGHCLRDALADALMKRAMDLPPGERKPFVEEVLKLTRRTSDFWRKAGDARRTAWSLHELGYVHFVAGETKDGAPYWEEAVKLYAALPERFLEIVDLGLEKSQADRLAQWSRRGYESQAGDYLLLGLARHNEGLTDAGRAPESIYLYAECLRLGMAHRNVTPINNVGALMFLRGIGDATGRARRIHYLNLVLRALPDAAANPRWRDRGRLSEAGQAVGWIHARAHEYLGGIYAETGQTLLARHHLDRAETFAADLDDAAILPLVLEAKARLWERIGQTDEALRCCRDILDGKNRASLGQRSDVICMMGRLYEQQGDFERARDCYRWALDLFVKPGSFTLNRSDVLAVGKVRAAVARMEVERGAPEAALKALGEAASFAALDDTALAARYQLERLGLADWAGAPDRYRPSRALLDALERGKDDPLLERPPARGLKLEPLAPPPVPAATAEGQRKGPLTREQVRFLRPRLLVTPPGDVRKERSDSEAKMEKLSASMETYKEGYRQVRARLAVAADKPARAAELLQEELDAQWKAADRDLDPVLLIESPEEMQQAHRAAAALQVRSGRPAEALRILDTLRDRALLRLAVRGRDVWEQLTPAQRAEAARLDDHRAKLSRLVLELARRVAGEPGLADTLRRERQRLGQAEAAWQTFKAKVSEDHKLPVPQRLPLSPRQLDELLADGEGVLLFAVGPYETCAVLARRTEGKTHFTGKLMAIRRGELEALVSAFRLGCSRPGGAHELLGRELYSILIAPFAGEIDRLRVLAIAPDGPLSVLPFGALQDDAGKYLLERLPLAGVTSLALQHRIRATPRPPRRGALVVDVQTFRDAFWVPTAYRSQVDPTVLAALVPRVRLGQLSGTRKEADELAALFGDRVERLGEGAAQEVAVKKAAAGKRFLHFATHGLVDPYNPFRSALVLARPQRGSKEDGFLEAAEVLEAQGFSGAELVTLSACESGLGMLQGSEGVLGLSWVFLAAGNRAVLASLWSVHDASTAELMVQFYRRLLDGKSKAQALREAALALRESPATAHPAYWAPFQLLGDWAP